MDRNWVTLVAYGVLLLAFALPAWLASGAVVAAFLSDEEPIGHNLLFLLIWGPACLVVALPTSLALLRLLRRRWAAFSTLVGWSALLTTATLTYLVHQGLFNPLSMDYEYILESTDVRVVSIACVLAALVLASTANDVWRQRRKNTLPR